MSRDPVPPPKPRQVDLAAAERAPEVRHYLIIDMGTQWFTKLLRREIEISWEKQKKGSDVRRETVVSENVLDVSSNLTYQPFLCNIYGREQVPTITLEGQSWGGWSISKWEYERIKRLIELAPGVDEFKKLAAYPNL